MAQTETTTPVGRRERKKQQTRDALERAALRLFVSKGFSHTTVEDITESADVSARTFFRYFDNKEAVLFARSAEVLADLETALYSRSADEDLLTAVGCALRLVARAQESDRTHNLLRARISLDAPEVRGRAAEAQQSWEEVIATWIRARLACPEADMRPGLIAGACVAALRTALAQWIAHGGVASPADLFDEAMDLLQNGFGLDRV